MSDPVGQAVASGASQPASASSPAAIGSTLYSHGENTRTCPHPRTLVGRALSRRALDAALRLALTDGATLVPMFLARVPMHMPLDSPLPRQCTEGMPLLETIEQRAFGLGVPVDARIERGRTVRHAMREAIVHERYDRLVVAAASGRSEGLQSDDIAWLLDHAPGEVVVIRPDGDDRLSLQRRTILRRAAPHAARPSAGADLAHQR